MSKLPMLSGHARRTGVDIQQITSYSPTSWPWAPPQTRAAGAVPTYKHH